MFHNSSIRNRDCHEMTALFYTVGSKQTRYAGYADSIYFKKSKNPSHCHVPLNTEEYIKWQMNKFANSYLRSLLISLWPISYLGKPKRF
jgi:hypothetical protein